MVVFRCHINPRCTSSLSAEAWVVAVVLVTYLKTGVLEEKVKEV